MESKKMKFHQHMRNTLCFFNKEIGKKLSDVPFRRIVTKLENLHMSHLQLFANLPHLHLTQVAMPFKFGAIEFGLMNTFWLFFHL